MDGRLIFWLAAYFFALSIRVSQEQYRGCLELSLVGKKRNLNIGDSSYTASSEFDYRYKPHNAKLYGKYGWAPKDKNNSDDYLQIDLGTPRVITAVATQGNGGDPKIKIHKTKSEWVRTYYINYTNDPTVKWTSYAESNMSVKKFIGNTDQDSVTRHNLSKPITARYIRFVPVKFYEYKTMRVNVYVDSQKPALSSLVVKPLERSVAVNWTIETCPNAKPITAFLVRVGKVERKVQSNKSSYTWTNLKPYTEYSVSVKAETQNGSGVSSQMRKIWTLIAEPEEAPNVSAQVTSSESIVLRWKINRDKINGPFKAYRISYTPQGRNTKSFDVGNVTTYTLTSLLKYTTYIITIAVSNTNYVGPQSTKRTVKTKEDAPSVPRNVRHTFTPARGLRRPRVVVMWETPRSLNGIIRNYTIIYYFNKNTNRKVIVSNSAGKTNYLKLSITVIPSGTFSYRISASTIKEGPYSTEKRIAIPEYKCPERSLIGKNRLSIPKSHYNASSYYDARFVPSNATLNGKYGWAPKTNYNPNDYLEIDLGKPRIVTAVATQGNGNTGIDEWVTKYKLYYKLSTYTFVDEFQGNKDSSNVVRNDLKNPEVARYIKFVPKTYNIHKTMRVNVYVSYQEPPRITKVSEGERCIEIRWTVKSCSPSHPIKGYSVKIADKTQNITTSKLEYTHTEKNLKPYTEYNVSVRAIKQHVGYGEWSITTTFKTAIAEPEAVPDISSVKAEKPQSITVKWKLKSNSEKINGPFMGYKIFYTPGGEKTKTKDVGKVTTYTLTSLKKYTDYIITIAVSNTMYTGPLSTKKSVRTTQDIPNKSPDVTSIKVRSSDSIFLEWKKVDRDEMNGIFQAYRITYKPQGGTANTNDVGDVTKYILTSLRKYTEYSVTIAVMNEMFVGPPSKEHIVRTLQDAPSAPVNVNGTLIPAQDSFGPRAVITWDKPLYPNGIIIKYTIGYHYNKDTPNEEIVTINGTSDLQYTMNVTNTGVLSFRISATTIKEGPYQSGNIVIPSASDHKKASQGNTTDAGSAKTGLVAGLVVGIILIILFLILAFLIWRRKRKQQRYEAAEPLPMEIVDDTLSSAIVNTNTDNIYQETAPELVPAVFSTEMARNRSSRSSSRTPPVMPIKRTIEFPAPNTYKLKKEFKSIPVDSRFDCKEGTKPGNKVKNRYKNIIAYDHSLVTVEWVYGETESFYINANYIHGHDGTPEVYIATQGPLENTLDDFWRMIWEQKVSSIVMLTNLKEIGKIKCYQYWPNNCDHYSDITVTTQKTEIFADFTIRTFSLSKAGSSNRRVRQFHFTAWPDKGVPHHATAVLSFRRKVLALTSNDDSSPIVVHCSAGVGRTGTYIMIDGMLRQAEEQQRVDVLNYLKTIRNDRPYMVQTVEQYIFVNMAIHDALTCGNTEVPVQNLLYAIQQLSIVDRRHKLTGYFLEFQRLEDVTSEDTKSGNFDVGLSRKNSKKNRYPNIVAANANRVILSTDNDTEIGDYINFSIIEAYKERKGDYINASFVDTYREHNAFIMTQAPMENTIADFWRMVLDYKIGTIVMLNNLQEGDEVFPQYWPLHETKTYEGTKVRLEETRHLAGNIILRMIEVSNRRKLLIVHHFQHLTWENKSVPTNPQSVLKLLHEVQKSQQKSGNSPIVVMCSNGVGRSGTFCAVASCLERVKQEQVLDVFQTVKSIRANRPGAVETLTQYVFCYNIFQKYLDSFRDYANFGEI